MNKKVIDFLLLYDEDVCKNALVLREILFDSFPGITEQLDLPAKMVAYCYGQRNTELICVIIPSKKELKLGFNRGVDLADREKLLEGTGKISRYIVIKNEKQMKSTALKQLLENALNTYKERIKK